MKNIVFNYTDECYNFMNRYILSKNIYYQYNQYSLHGDNAAGSVPVVPTPVCLPVSAVRAMMEPVTLQDSSPSTVTVVSSLLPVCHIHTHVTI